MILNLDNQFLFDKKPEKDDDLKKIDTMEQAYKEDKAELEGEGNDDLKYSPGKSVKIDEKNIILGETGSIGDHHGFEGEDSLRAVQDDNDQQIIQFNNNSNAIAASNFMSGNFGSK